MPPKYPVPRLAEQIIQEWLEELAAHYGCAADAIRDASTRAMSYPTQTVRIELMDGSKAEFKYAFPIVSESRRSVAIFTEHCGHHVFPYHEAKVFCDGVVIYEQKSDSSRGLRKS